MKSIIIALLILFSCISVYSPGRELDKQMQKKADFRTCLNYILKNEGYYSDHPLDFGGETYCGITKNYCKNWAGWQYLDEYKRKHGKIEWNTHIEELDHWVLDFYLDLWVKEGWYELNDQNIASYCFDFRVNGTVGNRIIRRSLTDLGFRIPIENTMDSSTILCINRANKHIFLKTLNNRRLIFYNNIIKRDSSQKVFINSWRNRCKLL